MSLFKTEVDNALDALDIALGNVRKALAAESPHQVPFGAAKKLYVKALQEMALAVEPAPDQIDVKITSIDIFDFNRSTSFEVTRLPAGSPTGGRLAMSVVVPTLLSQTEQQTLEDDLRLFAQKIPRGWLHQQK